jgi:hypothetical protein
MRSREKRLLVSSSPCVRLSASISTAPSGWVSVTSLFRVKWHQTVWTSDEVQTLGQCATMLRYTYPAYLSANTKLQSLHA